MKKATKSTSKLVFILIAVLVLQTLAIGYLLVQDRSIQKKITDNEERTAILTGTALQQISMQSPVVLPREKLIAFPELGIALPYNDITKNLKYYTHDNNDFRVSSTILQDLEMRQLSCTELVRINTQSPDPYNPWEEAAGSVTLANGKTIHIIAAKAFANNEASTEECASEVWGLVTPQMVAAEFQKAQAL